MVSSTGTSVLGNDIIKVSNVFDQEMVDFLIEDCDKQLKYNSIVNREFNISVTKPILDCHGLSVCDDTSCTKDAEFPYSVDKWNKFAMKMQAIMFKYCDKLNIDKTLLTPHSCWLEHFAPNDNELFSALELMPVKISPIEDTDIWLNERCGVEKLTHFRMVYFLDSTSENYGLVIDHKSTPRHLKGKKNSLYIIPSNRYQAAAVYNRKRSNLMFHWYLHPKESLKEPTWKFPNKFNNKQYLKYVEERIKSEWLTKTS